uniref:Uncharacterized protein n=1 Tax=Magallana gigas TaxID=29159 RepID=A0A8W8MMH0_MAGGI
MGNEQDLMFHELAHDLDQIDYSSEGPWSPLISNSTCVPMEEDHITDQEMAPESMETDEALTSTRFGNNKGSWEKITQAEQEKTKKPLLSWAREVVHHFWFCSATANTKEDFIKRKLKNSFKTHLHYPSLSYNLKAGTDEFFSRRGKTGTFLDNRKDI